MESLKPAPLNRALRCCRILSILGGMVLLFNLVAWSFVSRGFDLGYQLGKSSTFSEKKLSNQDEIKFAPGDGTYKKLSNEYSSLAGWSVVFLLICVLLISVEVLKIDYIFIAGNVAILLLICVRLIWLLGFKDPALNESLDSPFNELVMQSRFYDFLSIAIAAILALLQLVTLVLSFFEKQLKNNR